MQELDEVGFEEARTEKWVKDSLDVIVLNALREKPLCGYDLITTIHDKFKVLLSPGTIYPLLYSMERTGMVQCDAKGRKKVYAVKDEAKTREFLAGFARVYGSVLKEVEDKTIKQVESQCRVTA